MDAYTGQPIKKSKRIEKLVENLYKKMPEIEADRACLITEAYKQNEDKPVVLKRALAFEHILDNIPITIRDLELIVGSASIAPRGCQTFPEFSYKWLEDEFDTVEKRSADPFYISEETKRRLKQANQYWQGKTTSELATAYMDENTLCAMKHNIFTPGNYFYNGVGHVTVNYGEVISGGFSKIIKRAEEEMDSLDMHDGDYAQKKQFLSASIISCKAAVRYAKRYSELAKKMAKTEKDEKRREELLNISKICMKVPENGAESFYEACQAFWFVQMLIQVESSGHSISPGRFDRYMYPYYKKDMESGKITREAAQELIDCIWVKLNDLNKVRDAASAEGFAGYSLFQNLIVGGQDEDGEDITNDLSYMCVEASMHVKLPAPSLSVRVWNKSPHSLLIKCAELTRTGIGLPAYYNDEVIILSLVNRGLSLKDARDYNIIGCVEPQKGGKTEGWHDAAFFNMCRPMELVFSSGEDKGEQIGPKTKSVEQMQSYEEFFEAYKTQMEYMISLLVNADNAIDTAHAKRCPLPFVSSMVDDCIKRGKSLQEGGAVYNFTGPQGFGIANVADSLYTVKKLVFEEKKFTLPELKDALVHNFGKSEKDDTDAIVLKIAEEMKKSGITVGESEISTITKEVMKNRGAANGGRYKEIHEIIESADKFGNDKDEVDRLAREGAYVYTKTLEKYKNPRGGMFQAGLYPVSANVPLGAQTGATPDGRYAKTPVADGVSPSAGRDVNGPTAAANSVAKIDHFIASNGTLFNMKFHPSALTGSSGLESFVSLILAYFDQKGSHMQFNVVSRQTLIDAQKHPENYKGLVVRVAGYSALFTTLSKSLQDDIINRTEQGGF